MSPQSTDKRLIQLDVRAASFDQEAQFLSGGNQQKVIIARWLARDPEILIFCEPTRGVDVAAKAAIYKIMRDLARRGRAILMISSDLPEIIGVSDRILVMREGTLAGELPGGATEEEVMAIAVGARSRTARDGLMSDQQAIAPAPAWRRYSAAPPLLLVGSIAALCRRRPVDRPDQNARDRRRRSASFSGWSGSASSRSGRLSPSSPDRSTFRSPT